MSYQKMAVQDLRLWADAHLGRRIPVDGRRTRYEYVVSWKVGKRKCGVWFRTTSGLRVYKRHPKSERRDWHDGSRPRLVATPARGHCVRGRVRLSQDT